MAKNNKLDTEARMTIKALAERGQSNRAIARLLRSAGARIPDRSGTLRLLHGGQLKRSKTGRRSSPDDYVSIVISSP